MLLYWRNFLFVAVALLLGLSMHMDVSSAQANCWAPQSWHSARDTLQPSNPYLLTEQGGFGTESIVGWTVGTKGSEAHGERVRLRLPAGTIVHFDPGASSVHGRHQTLRNEYQSKSVRMHEDGWGEGLKYTVYFCSQ